MTQRVIALDERTLMQHDISGKQLKKHAEVTAARLENAARCVVDYQVNEEILGMQILFDISMPRDADEELIMQLVNQQLYDLEVQLRE